MEGETPSGVHLSKKSTDPRLTTQQDSFRPTRTYPEKMSGIFVHSFDCAVSGVKDGEANVAADKPN